MLTFITSDFSHMGRAQEVFSMQCTCFQEIVLDKISTTCICFDTDYIK